jgi:hypothetical protein
MRNESLKSDDVDGLPYEVFVELLSHYENPANDDLLVEADTKIIEELVQRKNSPGQKGPRYYIFEDETAGITRPIGVNDKTRPVNVEAERYWYAPYRQTFTEVFGEGGTRISIEGVNIAKTPMDAIREAKRMAYVASFSGARNCTKTEVLLSGPLKLEGQSQPKWLDIRLLTQGQEARIQKDHLTIMKNLGYEPHV